MLIKLSKLRKKWIFIVCIIFVIILPSTIYGFRLRDLSSNDKSTEDNTDDGDDGKVSSSLSKGTLISKKTEIKPSRPFRKITKIVHVDDDGTEIEENLNRDESDDDDENDEDTDETDETDTDDGKYEFEKVHRSDFSKSSTPQSVFKTIAKEEEKEQDAEVEESSQKLLFVLPNILSIFGWTSEAPSKTTETKIDENSNGIINWIQSLIGQKEDEKKSIKRSTKDAEKDEDSSWITTYFNRWPFNVFIPFEKSDPNIWIPPVLPDVIESHDSKEPLSQDHFNYLLYHLPNFALQPSDISEINCREQVQVLQRQLRGNKLWTLQMLDASAKIPSGILKGNTNQFGDFDSCTHIKTLVKVSSEHNVKIKGKYCLAHIDIKYSNDDLKLPVHLAKGKGMWKSNIRNPGHLIPRYTTINWGICVPHQCSHNEVFEMLEKSLKPYNSTGINFHIQIKEDDCYVRKNRSIMNIVLADTRIIFTIGFYCTLIFFVLIATAIDYWDSITVWASQYIKKPDQDQSKKKIQNESDNSEVEMSVTEKVSSGKQENGDMRKNDFERIANQLSSRVISYLNSLQEYKVYFWAVIDYIKFLYYQIPERNRATISKLSYEILMSFSLKRTIPGLTYTDPEVDIVSLHTLKIISTFMLYLFTKFLMLGHLSIVNRDEMIKTLSNPLSILLRTPFIYMDTLLLIAGLLSSREMCKQFEQKAKISVLKIITGKLIRSLPTLCAILFFQSWILPYFGSGPLWNNLVQKNSDLCNENVWRNFFGVQNFVNVEEACAPFTVQLALDLQLLLIGCLLVWLYYNNEDIGFGIYGIFHAISVGARYSDTISERLSSVLFHGMNVSKFYRTANIMYSSPIDRATSYLIGIGAGVLIWTSETTELKLPKTASILAWLSSIIGVLWCFWYPWYNTKINFIYDSSNAAVYSSWAPLFLSLGLAWMIFASSFTTTSFLHSIFYSKPLIFLSKISYPMQLLIFSVIMYNVALNKEPIRFHLTDLMNIGEIFVIIIMATFIAIIIDHPFQNIRKLLLETEFSMVSSHEEEDKEEEIINAISDTKLDEGKRTEIDKENQEDIWGNENEDKTSSLFIKKHDQSPTIDWNDSNEDTKENWRTESDLEQYHSELLSNDQSNDKYENEINEADEENPDDHIEHEEEKEEEEEEEIVQRRPSSSEQTYRRRRWNFDAY